MSHKCHVMFSHSVMSNSLQPHGLQPTRLLCPQDFPGKNTGMGCYFLLQEISCYSLSNMYLICTIFKPCLSPVRGTTNAQDALDVFNDSVIIPGRACMKPSSDFCSTQKKTQFSVLVCEDYKLTSILIFQPSAICPFISVILIQDRRRYAIVKDNPS